MPLNEYEFPTAKVANVQSQLERLVEKNYYLHQSAREAYRGYLLAYNSHQLKDAFNVHTLDLLAVARSFGFAQPPRVRPRSAALPCLALEGGWPVCRRRALAVWVAEQQAACYKELRVTDMGARHIGAQAWVMNRMIGQNPTPDDCICTQYQLTGHCRACRATAALLPLPCLRAVA